MDSKIEAVLETFHACIREEQGKPRDISDPKDRDQKLLAVGPDTGFFINILAKNFKAPNILEIGTSYGYSAIWLGEAARSAGGRVTTLELQDYKSAYARKQSYKAGLSDFIQFKVGDALNLINALQDKFDFVLLDLWKDLYVPCLEAVFPRLNEGAIIVADNILRPGGEDVARYVRAVRAKPGIRSVLLPIGSGLEVSRLDSTA